MSTTNPKMTLIKFGADYCAPCKAMDKNKLLERFVEKHPNVTVQKLSIANKDGETEKGTEYDKNNKRSDIYGVSALPTLIFEDANGGELARVEGGVNLKDLESLYERALSRANLRGAGEDGDAEEEYEDEDADVDDDSGDDEPEEG